MAVVDVRATGSPQDIRALITVINQMQEAVVELQDNFNAALAQLDDDAGVTDTDYEATHEATTAVDTLQTRF